MISFGTLRSSYGSSLSVLEFTISTHSNAFIMQESTFIRSPERSSHLNKIKKQIRSRASHRFLHPGHPHQGGGFKPTTEGRRSKHGIHAKTASRNKAKKKKTKQGFNPSKLHRRNQNHIYAKEWFSRRTVCHQRTGAANHIMCVWGGKRDNREKEGIKITC